ncbi:MAG: hypothetical protein HYW45_01540 [Candidatus Daviesbacteria bacterium]|nr:MAG: hypothetical protein HYW45_01540 [Candidatus Daviesbacteria bacterium]
MQVMGLVGEIKNLLPSAKNILIALPVGVNIDKLAAGLSLYLSLKQAGYEISIVGEDTMRVSQAHLFGVDQVQQTLPEVGGGDLIVTLEGVAVPDTTSETGWKVPNLTNIDYNTTAGNMELIFRTNSSPLQPTKIVPRYQGGRPELIFVLGAANLNSLGAVYTNQTIFSGVHLVNIDSEANANFGQTNIVDPSAASISEMVAVLLNSLGLNIDQDVATNLLAGIFDGTANLTSNKVNADTFMAVSQLLQKGGQKPALSQQLQTGGLDLSGLMPNQPAPVSPQPIVQPTPVVPAPPSLNINPITNEPFVNPPVVGVNSAPISQPGNSSPEERPSMETVVSENEIEPGWLTPKIFKGNGG